MKNFFKVIAIAFGLLVLAVAAIDIQYYNSADYKAGVAAAEQWDKEQAEREAFLDAHPEVREKQEREAKEAAANEKMKEVEAYNKLSPIQREGRALWLRDQARPDPYGLNAANKAIMDGNCGKSGNPSCTEVVQQKRDADRRLVQDIQNTQEQRYQHDQEVIHDEQLRQQVRQQ